MAEVKWIKITTNMFDDEKINFIESLPEADAILIIWIKLLTLAGKCNAGGFIFLTEKIPYTPEMLAHTFRRPLNTVKMALKTLENLEMIEFNNEGYLKIANWAKHQNVTGLEKIREQNRIRQARYRAKQKALSDGKEQNQIDSNVTNNVTVTQDNAPDIDIEEDIDKEIDIDTTTIEKPPATPYDEIVNMYNSICISFNPVKRITDKRKGTMNARYRENNNDLEVFRTVFTKVQNSTFLKGGWNTGGKADFDWIMRPTNFVKILEGKYDDKNKPKPKQNDNLSKLEEMYQQALEEEGGIKWI